MTFNADLSRSKQELSRASDGIRNPAVATLYAGEAFFRFASITDPTTGTGIPSTDWARRPWWLREDDYRKVLQRYQQGELSFGTVARSAAAVQPSWSAMDVSIKARLVADINVYVGKGKVQYRDLLPNGMDITLRGWPDIDQVYIPDIRGKASAALQVIRQKIITSDRFGF